MKSLKLIAASLLAFAVVGSAFAQVTPTGNQVYLRYIGSTAFRAAVHQSIENAMGGAGHYTVLFDGSNDTAKKFNAAIFYGTIAGKETIVKTYWTGSIAGIVELSQGENLGAVFPADSNLGLGTTTPNAATALVSSYAKEAASIATVAMADNPASEAAAILSTANAAGKAAAAVVNAAALQDAGTIAGANGGPVALVSFQWVLGPSDDSRVPFSNVTQQQAAALVKQGYEPLSAFTGLASDSNNYVFLVGRNEDSGTRNAAFAEAQTGFGQGANQVLVTGNPVTALAKYPITGMYLETAISWNKLGHSGYSTGGNVAGAVASVMPNTAGLGAGMGNIKPSGWVNASSKAYLLAYLGISDVASATNCTALTYNGVPFSSGNVNNGLYTFWNYEHCYYLTSGTNNINTGDNGQAAGTAKLVADTIADQLYNTDATFDAGSGPAGVKITPSLLVTRAQGGAYVSPNY